MASSVPSEASAHVQVFLVEAGVCPGIHSDTGLGMHPHPILHSSHDAHGFPGLHSLLAAHLQLHRVPWPHEQRSLEAATWHLLTWP